MPSSISTHPANIHLDERSISTQDITSSLSSGAALEAEVKSTLETQEVRDGEWDLYVHVYDKATAWIGIHMCRHGHHMPDDWWEAALPDYVERANTLSLEERESPTELESPSELSE